MKYVNRVKEYVRSQSPKMQTFIGLVLFLEIAAFFKMFVVWGPLMGSFLVFLNGGLVCSSIALTFAIQEYREKDLAYDLWRFNQIRAFMQGAWKFTRETLATYKIKSANTIPAIMR